MGKRGFAPKPTNLRLLHGERNLTRINDDEPQPQVRLPRLPDDVSDEVRTVFEDTVSELDAMGLAFKADSHALHCYAEAVVAHRNASAILARSSVLVKGIHGSMIRNPALQVQRDAAATVRAFAQEFGLTPSARSTIRSQEAGTGGEQDTNPFAGAG